MTKQSFIVLSKIALAAAFIALLTGVAMSKVLPGVSMTLLALYVLAGLIGFFVVMTVLTIFSLTFNQFILRNGGTDTSWFWFAGEPKGLQQLREHAAEEKALRAKS